MVYTAVPITGSAAVSLAALTCAGVAEVGFTAAGGVALAPIGVDAVAARYLPIPAAWCTVRILVPVSARLAVVTPVSTDVRVATPATARVAVVTPASVEVDVLTPARARVRIEE